MSWQSRKKHSISARSAISARFAGAAAWSVIGAGLSSATTMVMMMLVARILEKESYGQLVLLQSTLASIALLGGLGMGLISTRYTAELRVRDPLRLGRVLTLTCRFTFYGALVAAIAVILGAKFIASYLLSLADLYTPVMLAAPSVFFLALDFNNKSILIGLESMKIVALTTLSGALLGVPLMLYLTARHDLNGAAFALSLIALIQVGFSEIMTRRELARLQIQRPTPGWWQEHSLIGSYALPALLSTGLVGPAHWAAQAILASRPDGYAQVAVFGIAMQWFQVIMFIPTNAARVVLPILTDSVVDQDHQGSRTILGYSVAANALFALPFAACIFLFSDTILSLYGSDYFNETTPIVLTTATAALLAIIGPIGTMIAASARMWLGAGMNGVWATIYIGLTYFVLGHNATGVAVALALAYVMHSIWTLWFAHMNLRTVTLPENLA